MFECILPQTGNVFTPREVEKVINAVDKMAK